MSFQESLDSLPIGAFFVAYTVVAATISESGYRLGNWWQERTPEEREGPTGMIVGSLLALMAFLGFTPDFTDTYEKADAAD